MSDTSDYIYIPIASGKCWEQPENATNGFSYCVWLKIMAEGMILSTVEMRDYQGFELKYYSGQLTSKVYARDYRKKIWPNFSSGNNWKHICTTWLPDAMKLYINGFDTGGQESTYTNVPPHFVGGSSLIVGRKYTVDSEVATKNFEIDELVIWCVKLSDQDILNLYNSY